MAREKWTCPALSTGFGTMSGTQNKLMPRDAEAARQERIQGSQPQARDSDDPVPNQKPSDPPERDVMTSIKNPENEAENPAPMRSLTGDQDGKRTNTALQPSAVPALEQDSRGNAIPFEEPTQG